MRKFVVLLPLVGVAIAVGQQVPGHDLFFRDAAVQLLEPAAGPATSDDTSIISYDDGTHRTWWCSDRDSFGAAVKFTPAAYPCFVVGTRAEVGYDVANQNYLRVFDDDGPDGKPGTVLYEQHRSDIPQGQNIGFRDYDLTAPVTIEDGDFYICFWQKGVFNLLFGTDQSFDSIARQWWFFPDLGWVTPMGMDAADHLIRAKVTYQSAVREQPLAEGYPAVSLSPNPARDVVMVRCPDFGDGHASVTVCDATGRVLMRRDAIADGSCLDVSLLPAGVYVVRLSGTERTFTTRLTIE